MLYVLACFTNTHPSIPTQLERDISEIQHRVQRIEDLSNQLIVAQKKQDKAAMQVIVKELDDENIRLQKQKSTFQESLKVRAK